MRYLIKFSYDGSNFSGFQKQPNLRCVESEFEKALFNINNKKVTPFVSSGRTDRGVHALSQTAHFDLDIDITLYKLKCALNSLLPSDIHVFSVEVVSDDFHARYMAKEKTYEYLMNIAEYDSIKRKYIYQYCKDIDVKRMNKAIKNFIGEHDFEYFVSEEAKKSNYKRIIYDAYIEKDKNIIKFVFKGSGFMKYQVRNMVGTLIKIGNGKLDIDIIDDLLKLKANRDLVSAAKREGLYLVEVKY